MAFKPGFDQSPAFNDQGRGAWGAGAGQQQAGWGRTPQQGQYPQQGGMTPEQLQYMYDRPTANPVDTDRMSYEDTIVKTLLAFGVLLVGAVAGWNLPPIVWIVGAIVGFVLALVNTFKKKPSPAWSWRTRSSRACSSVASRQRSTRSRTASSRRRSSERSASSP